jgi:ribosomal protein S18 acetylase RimI-like enzyme
MTTQTGQYELIKKYLAPEWSTERIQIKDSKIQDVPLLTEIFNSCNYVEHWDPTFYIVEESELKQLVKRSLSKTVNNRGFRLQCLEVKHSGKIIGYFHLQHYSPRLPQPATAFISMFVVHPEFQGKRYAQEVVAGLARQLAELGYIAIWLEVYLKNWPAIRFWVQQGFNKIIEYDGADQFSETAQATLILERRLKVNNRIKIEKFNHRGMDDSQQKKV